MKRNVLAVSDVFCKENWTFNRPEIHKNDSPLSANSGRSRDRRDGAMIVGAAFFGRNVYE